MLFQSFSTQQPGGQFHIISLLKAFQWPLFTLLGFNFLRKKVWPPRCAWSYPGLPGAFPILLALHTASLFPSLWQFSFPQTSPGQLLLSFMFLYIGHFLKRDSHFTTLLDYFFILFIISLSLWEFLFATSCQILVISTAL